jgi:hypothetical protein
MPLMRMQQPVMKEREKGKFRTVMSMAAACRVAKG